MIKTKIKIGLFISLFIASAVFLAFFLYSINPLEVKASSLPKIKGNYVNGTILIKFRSEIKKSIDLQNQKIVLPSLNYLNQKHQLTEIKALFPDQRHANDAMGSIYKLNFPANQKVEELVADYQNNPMVEFAEPDYLAQAAFVPDDPYYSYQWNFTKVNMPAAWEFDTTAPLYGGDSSVVVAVLDSGVSYEDYSSYGQAPDLASTTFTDGYDFINNDAHPNDDNGHGTHVTGTIAQSTNNSIGVAGIAFNSTIMPVKVLDATGWGAYSAIAQGIDYAVNNGADIINMSLGGADSDAALQTAIENAEEAGVIVIAATGNSYDTSIYYPARYDSVIAIGATNVNDQRADYSNYGTGIDLVAPGGDESGYIYQDTFYNLDEDGHPLDYTTFGYVGYMGTSMASPHVAGAAALLLAYGVDPSNVLNVLTSSAEDLGSAGYDTEYGYGRLDVSAALYSVASDTTAPTNPTIKAYESNKKKTTYKSGSRYNDLSPYFEWSGAEDSETGIAGYYKYLGTDKNADPETEGTFYTNDHFTASVSGGNNVKYYLRIKTRDTAGNVSATAVQFTYIIDTEVVKPTGLSLSNGSDGIHLSWNKSTDSHWESYNVYDAGKKGNGPYTKLNEAAITKNSYVDSDVEEDETYYYVVAAIDNLGNRSDRSTAKSITRPMQSDIIMGTGPGGGPQVRVFKPNGSLISQFFAYDSSFRGGVNVAVGDLDGNGVNEIITGTGSGGSPQVRIFDLNGKPKFTNGFFAYAENVKNGVNVATGDLDGNGKDEIITGTGSGSGPHVRTFDRYGKAVFSPGFFAYGTNVRNGVYVATGDLDGNGKDEIITGTGNGAGPHVRTFNKIGTPLFSMGFFPYTSSSRGGVRVATADIDANGKDEILTAPGPGISPQIRVFNKIGSPVGTNGFLAFSSGFQGGVFIAGGDTNQDLKDEIIVSVGSNSSPLIRIFNKTGSSILKEFYGTTQTFTGGINVASAPM